MAHQIPNAQPLFFNRDENPHLRQLSTLCNAKHMQNGKFISNMIRLASLIASLYVLWLTPAMYAFESTIAASAIYYCLGPLLKDIYDTIRNRDYLDASEALQTEPFRNFLVQRRLTPTIRSIVLTHQVFEAFTQDQMDREFNLTGE